MQAGSASDPPAIMAAAMEPMLKFRRHSTWAVVVGWSIVAVVIEATR